VGRMLRAPLWAWQARPQLEESMVTDNDSGAGLKSQVRTSSGMFIANKVCAPPLSCVFPPLLPSSLLCPPHPPCSLAHARLGLALALALCGGLATASG